MPMCCRLSYLKVFKQPSLEWSVLDGEQTIHVAVAVLSIIIWGFLDNSNSVCYDTNYQISFIMCHKHIVP